MSKHRHMEQDAVVRFSGELESRFFALHAAGKHLPYLIGSALSGQDKDLADYLLAARGRFALIEFKASREEIKTELDKPARLCLLERCSKNRALLARSQSIHHFGWEKLEETHLPHFGKQLESSIDIARYIPALAKLTQHGVVSAKERSWHYKDFITSYLECESAGANLRRFQRYVAELFSIAGKNEKEGFGKFEGSIFVFIPGGSQPSQIKTFRFKSFEHLLELTILSERALKHQKEQKLSRSERDHGLSL